MSVAQEASKKISEIKLNYWLILMVILVGVILRTYHHSEWLRFNPDQARDAQVVGDMIEKGEAPLLGPKAGGTEFRLGPAFYYFQYMGGIIFGNDPVSFAYPDLFFSVMAIPLSYLLFRKYFGVKTALLLAALVSVSFFNLRYGRFAWNPNSMLFWGMLFFFSIIKLFETTSRRKFIWSAVAGVSLGVAIQLHSIFLVMLPVFAVLIFLFFGYKKMRIVKYLAVLVLCSVILNIPQVLNELRTDGKNVKAFFKAYDNKEEKNTSIFRAAGNALACTVQANYHIVSGMGADDECEYPKARKILSGGRTYESAFFIFNLILASFLFFGGMFLFAKKIRIEKDEELKNNYLVLAIFSVLYFLVLIPVSKDIAMRFYIGSAFIAFILLGLIIEEARGRISPKAGKYFFPAVLILFVGTNVYAVRDLFSSFQDPKEVSNEIDVVTYGEIKDIVKFITEQNGEERVAFISGKSGLMFKLFRPLRYEGARFGLELKEKKGKAEELGFPVYEMKPAKNADGGGAETFGRFSVSKK